ncbi:hypothetical protein cce_1444 [Crocosphaera subtropica ATCC 51142]|uniref:PEP-CTERM protein-sorting domain-containing protein n=1 Tax=Crocosphaera subtropica (strain ATCC 51142 / BH68) TaxID=43989 RepID=B1WX50_CROS5|nr:hypothetical protein [Crocosphaera subtropica]ACB50794.1 hypothetical protein cce_1444 [Crocosphaera subtropica ATCC 51142]
MKFLIPTSCILMASIVGTVPALASNFSFSTGDPDGLIGTASRPGGSGLSEVETGDDFIVNEFTLIDEISFTGLLIGNNPVINEVLVEVYRIFPQDSQNPPSGNVPTRENSPADVAFQERTVTSEEFTPMLLENSFEVANTVGENINPLPNPITGGEGAASGELVRIDVRLFEPFTLPADHYFFVPQVGVDNGEFLWASASKPIVAPGTPFAPDLQTWIRDEALDPDWLRIGTDVIGEGAFNASFSLSGQTASVSEPSGIFGLFALGSLTIASQVKRRLK